MAWPRHADPLFTSYNPPVFTRRQADDYYAERQRNPRCRHYSVECRGKGALVGRISLRQMEMMERSAVLGISFHPEQLGRGLGTEALQAFLDHYFYSMRMHALFLDVAAFNSRAIRVYEKCGFRAGGQRWGDPEYDHAGVLHRPDYRDIRHLFRGEGGCVRPLMIDMALDARGRRPGGPPDRRSA